MHKPVLRTLDLGNNCLRSVPPELGLCDCLRSLVLHGNPQRAIRAETLPKDTLKVLARLRDRLPMDVVERHMKREEDLQSIEDSHESFDERYTSPPPPTGPPPKTGYGSTPPPPDGPHLYCLIMRAFGPQGCSAVTTARVGHGLVAGTGPGPRDGLEPPGRPDY